MSKAMKLGEKIRSERIKKKITQSELAGEKITRNMLSAIENGTALPSLDTLMHLSDKLDLSPSYLLSDDDDSFLYEKRSAIGSILGAFGNADYKRCVETIESLSERDDELNYILTMSCLKLGRDSLLRGSMTSAHNYFVKAEQSAKMTVYDTSSAENLIMLYSSVVENFQAPLLVLDIEKYITESSKISDTEFFKYLTHDNDYNFKEEGYALALKGKALMKERYYKEAVEILQKAVDVQKSSGYNAIVIYGIYTDLEYCFKQLYDFESAYNYSSKRLSMLEGFKT